MTGIWRWWMSLTNFGRVFIGVILTAIVLFIWGLTVASEPVEPVPNDEVTQMLCENARLHNQPAQYAEVCR